MSLLEITRHLCAFSLHMFHCWINYFTLINVSIGNNDINITNAVSYININADQWSKQLLSICSPQQALQSLMFYRPEIM